MIRRGNAGVAILAALSLNLLTAAANKPSESSIAKGQELAAELRSRTPPENLEVNGVLKLRSSDGKRTKVPIRYRIVVADKHWESIYETVLSDGTAPERLHVFHADGEPNRYLLSRPASGQAPSGEPISLSSEKAMVPFANSDFWLTDLGLEFLHWPQQRIVEEAKIRMRKGRPCRVLESINTSPGATGYTRVRSWIDAKTGGVILAEAYGPAGKRMKEFEVGGLVKINGTWELKNMEMRNASTDSLTVLEFKYEQRE